jgi:hypothetical protein
MLPGSKFFEVRARPDIWVATDPFEDGVVLPLQPRVSPWKPSMGFNEGPWGTQLRNSAHINCPRFIENIAEHLAVKVTY